MSVMFRKKFLMVGEIFALIKSRAEELARATAPQLHGPTDWWLRDIEFKEDSVMAYVYPTSDRYEVDDWFYVLLTIEEIEMEQHTWRWEIDRRRLEKEKEETLQKSAEFDKEKIERYKIYLKLKEEFNDIV